MCGNNDLVKQDGYFVCQYCGTKYTVEEARKLMVEIEGVVEVKGTVKVDNKELVDNYLSMAVASYDGQDAAGVVNYCDKALELDPKNSKAWVLKAKSACWNSTLSNIKLPQSVAAAKKALDLAADEDKEKIADDIYKELKDNVNALLDLAYQMPSIGSQAEYVHKVMMQWGETLAGVPYISQKMIEEELNDCREACKNSKKAFMPGKRILYSAYFSFNHNESYDVTFQKLLNK